MAQRSDDMMPSDVSISPRGTSARFAQSCKYRRGNKGEIPTPTSASHPTHYQISISVSKSPSTVHFHSAEQFSRFGCSSNCNRLPVLVDLPARSMSNTQAINKTWLVIISRTMNMVNQATFTASKQNQVHQQETNVILVIQRIALSMHLLHSISAPISPYPFHATLSPFPSTKCNQTHHKHYAICRCKCSANLPPPF